MSTWGGPFREGDRVRSICCGRFLGYTGTVKRRICAYGGQEYYKVDFDALPDGPEIGVVTMSNLQLAPEGGPDNG